MAKTTILSAALTEKLITSIKGRSAKLDNDIHQAACSALAHHVAHGDVTLINRLSMALPKSARRNALFAWALHFDGKLAMNTDKATKAESPLMHAKGDGTADIDAAIEMPFWEFAPEPAYVQFDLNAAIAALLKKAEGALASEKQDTNLVAPDKLAALRLLAGVAPDAVPETSAE